MLRFNQTQKKSPPSGCSGLTIVEVHLALAVAAIMAILLFSLYGITSRSARDQQQRRRGGAALSQALAIIAHDLTLSMPVYGHEAGGFLLATEEGTRGPISQIAFSVPRLGDVPGDPPDLRWFHTVAVEYRLDRGPGERGRLLQTERRLIGPEALQPARTNILAVGVDEFHVQVQVEEDWLDEYTGDPDAWEELRWPRTAKIRIVGDRQIRGEREHEVEVLIPAGWTLTPAK